MNRALTPGVAVAMRAGATGGGSIAARAVAPKLAPGALRRDAGFPARRPMLRLGRQNLEGAGGPWGPFIESMASLVRVAVELSREDVRLRLATKKMATIRPPKSHE